MPPPLALSTLSEADKDAQIRALWAQVQELQQQNAQLTARLADLEAKLKEPSKTSHNSSVPPSQGPQPNRPSRSKRAGPRRGSLGRKGGGRPLASDPDQVVIAKATTCVHCHGALTDADQKLQARYDKIDLPPVRPVVTRLERYLGHCPGCGGATLAPVPEGLEGGAPFRLSILTVALYLRFVHAVSYRRLVRLFRHLFALEISEGALDALFQRAKPRFDNEVAAILARLRRGRLICSDETTVRVQGQTHWNWVFQNDEVVIHVIRPTRGRTSGCRTSTAPSVGMPTTGRSVWPTSCATCAMPSKRATRSSLQP